MSPRLPRTVLWVVAAFYAYGAAVHVLNILGLTGFQWAEAPLKWQVLDIAYLAVDGVVVARLPAGARLGYWAFSGAATSQVVLYTVLRDWILDVPEAFARSPQDLAYLDALVVFHVVTLVLVMAAQRRLARAQRTDP